MYNLVMYGAARRTVLRCHKGDQHYIRFKENQISCLSCLQSKINKCPGEGHHKDHCSLGGLTSTISYSQKQPRLRDVMSPDSLPPTCPHPVCPLGSLLTPVLEHRPACSSYALTPLGSSTSCSLSPTWQYHVSTSTRHSPTDWVCVCIPTRYL